MATEAALGNNGSDDEGHSGSSALSNVALGEPRQPEAAMQNSTAPNDINTVTALISSVAALINVITAQKEQMDDVLGHLQAMSLGSG